MGKANANITIFLLILIPVVFLTGCISPQEGGNDSRGEDMVSTTNANTGEKHTRESVVAGSWYPGSKEGLSGMLDEFLGSVKKEDLGDIKAIIVPHAGYIYSGQVAAFGFKQIEGGDYNRVIILAPTHHHHFNGASISNYTHYRTPLGNVRLSPLAGELINESRLISNVPAAHSKEHSAEIEIPFLQKALGDFEIIPIVVGRMSDGDIDEFSDLISGHLDEKTLLVVSTDLSHYHPYNEAVAMDKSCVDSIVAGDIRGAKECEMCGRLPVLTAMRIAEKRSWQARLLKYANSGDITGDKSGVVGYAAIAFSTTSRKIKENSHDKLTNEQKKYLLKLARDTIELYVREGKTLDPKTEDPRLKEDRGVFVTLEKNGQLRGCIGHIEPVQPLYLDVRDNAISAAVHDPRFGAVNVSELGEIEIEVSVLTRPELIKAGSPEEYLEKIQEGVDGIIIDYGGRSATYLPQVWEQIPGKEEFLGHLCEKAFLPGDCWKKQGVKIYRYGVVAFREGELDD